MRHRVRLVRYLRYSKVYSSTRRHVRHDLPGPKVSPLPRRRAGHSAAAVYLKSLAVTARLGSRSGRFGKGAACGSPVPVKTLARRAANSHQLATRYTSSSSSARSCTLVPNWGTPQQIAARKRTPRWPYRPQRAPSPITCQRRVKFWISCAPSRKKVHTFVLPIERHRTHTRPWFGGTLSDTYSVRPPCPPLQK